MPRILVIPDKFKGTLTARAAAEAMARGWAQARPGDTLELLPMSDGGDGFGEIVSALMGAVPQPATTVDAAHRPREATWWWHAPTRTAIVESAQAIGLALLPNGKYHPFELDTEGLGQLLRAAADRGAQRCLVGIGGSATNDGGFGMARALGWQFFNARDERIERWTELHNLAQIRPADDRLPFQDLAVAVDVQNPLLGPQGCTRIYGPQKGLKPQEFEFAERCLENLAMLMERELHAHCTETPGTGAAGGLGFGLHCFAGGRLVPGFQLFADAARLQDRLRTADLVLTGEGALDASTLMGKGVGELARWCREAGVPCIALAGVVPDVAAARAQFAGVYALTPEFATPEEALLNAAAYLEQAAARAGKEVSLVKA